jgi:hypothetical protein
MGFSILAYPRNFAPAGPNSKILEAMASPSIIGGGWMSLSFLRYLQVILMGMGAFRGGMITRTPEWRQPRMAPPLASTMKLTRNLKNVFQLLLEMFACTSTSFIVVQRELAGILRWVFVCFIILCSFLYPLIVFEFKWYF